MWSPSSFAPHVTAWAKSLAGDAPFDFTVVHAFALLGVCVVLFLAERSLDFVLFHATTPSKPLQGYRRRGPKPTYALVTGASAGIGRATAKALVQHGFGVVILGHKADELADAAAELRAALVLPPDADPDHPVPPRDEYVQTIVMDAMRATPDEMEAQLRAALIEPGLRVSILVNNVGDLPVAPPQLREQATFSADEIDNTIYVNARFMARLTTLMMPVLTHRGAGSDQGMSFGTHRRSLILNLSSGAMDGCPLVVLYSATKAFNWAFSRALGRELEANPETAHMDVLAVLPGEVNTQGNGAGLQRSVCEAEHFGRLIVEKADGAVRRGWREYCPYWKHHIDRILLRVVPDKMVSKAMVAGMRIKAPALDAYARARRDSSGEGDDKTK